jgi:hypothetical protein
VANFNAREKTTLSRRDVVQKLLGGMAAGAIAPLIASSHPVSRHLSDGALFDRAEEMSRAADWKPLFLNQEQSETLDALSEVVVPGAKTARVNRFIDLLLNVDSAEHQKGFVASLAVVDGDAKKTFGRGFAALTPGEQNTLLTNFSSEESRREDFHHLKDWIVGAYYSSEQGMRELGWDGNYAFASYPECEYEENRRTQP